MNRVLFRMIGEYSRDAVDVEWVESTWPSIEAIETAIETEWELANQRVGIKLFDGPMCRLESFHAAERLCIRLSRTSYKSFLGTNLTHVEFTDRYGPAALANPIGLSAALESSDGVVLLGRRSASLAYYPSRVHPFAGALEPREGLDIFREISRELTEELGLKETEITQMSFLGLVEDAALRQPEFVFYARCGKTLRQLEGQLDPAEHTAIVAVMPDQAAVESILNDPALTPVACAALLLWGRRRWGAGWFDAASRSVTLRI